MEILKTTKYKNIMVGVRQMTLMLIHLLMNVVGIFIAVMIIEILIFIQAHPIILVNIRI